MKKQKSSKRYKLIYKLNDVVCFKQYTYTTADYGLVLRSIYWSEQLEREGLKGIIIKRSFIRRAYLVLYEKKDGLGSFTTWFSQRDLKRVNK